MEPRAGERQNEGAALLVLDSSQSRVPGGEVDAPLRCLLECLPVNVEGGLAETDQANLGQGVVRR